MIFLFQQHENILDDPKNYFCVTQVIRSILQSQAESGAVNIIMYILFWEKYQY